MTPATPPPDRIDHARGTLLGLAVGDALGGPLEWLPPEEIDRRYVGPVTEMVGGGWLGLRPGQVTDDTEMTLCLARSLVEAGRYDPALATRNYLDWYRSDPPDVGNTIAAVLRAVKDGHHAPDEARRFHEASGGRSAGNGSLMRIAPLAIRYRDDPEALAEAARVDSRLTHYDRLAAEACVAYVKLIASAGSAGGGSSAPELPAGLGALLEALDSTRAEAAERASAQVGFVLTAMAVAVCAYRTATSFEEGLVWAVNLGRDADTNGAVTGALLGARFGANAIPSRWLDPLEPRHEMVSLADRLVASGSVGKGDATRSER